MSDMERYSNILSDSDRMEIALFLFSGEKNTTQIFDYMKSSIRGDYARSILGSDLENMEEANIIIYTEEGSWKIPDTVKYHLKKYYGLRG